LSIKCLLTVSGCRIVNLVFINSKWL